MVKQLAKVLENFEKADVKVLAPAKKEAINPRVNRKNALNSEMPARRTCLRGEMDITIAFEAIIGGSNPSGGTNEDVR